MTEMNPDTAAVKRFVREVLECNCPDTVFSRVDVQRGSTAVRSCSVNYEIRVGDRLLIVVTSSPQELISTSRLDGVLAEGKQARDTARLNRFRLVIATPKAAQWREKLSSLFDAAHSRDDKTHLHVIESGEMPDFFKPAAQNQ